MTCSESKRTLSKLFALEKPFVAERFVQAGIAPRLVEDQIQDFFVYLLEWVRRGDRETVDREELSCRVEVYLRSLRRKSPRPALQAWECLDACPDEPRGGERTIDIDFEQAMMDREQVVRFLQCMTEKSQLAVIVYYLVGLTREEMADIWGVSANTVATQAFRGIRQARSFGPRVAPEPSSEPTVAANHRVALPMEWGTIPLELTERSAHLVCPWYDPQRERQRWSRRTPFGSPQRPVMLWPQPASSPGGHAGASSRGRRSKAYRGRQKNDTATSEM